MKTKLVCTNVGEGEEEEKKNSLMTNPRSTSTRLSKLAPELVVMVASHLDVSSYLALASTSTNLSETLVSQLQWDELLKRTRLDLNLWMALLRRGDLFGPKFGQGSNRRYMKNEDGLDAWRRVG